MAGRPREFDRDAALAAAMDVFWECGFEATSIGDLLSAMSIGRQSLYDTFGDKRRLFHAAIEHYAGTNVQKVCDTLAAEGSPSENIRGLLRAAAADAVDGGPRGRRGCFVVNTAVEFGADDPQVAAIVRRCVKQIETAFRRTLRRAIKTGELAAEADVDRLTHLIAHTLHGFAVFSRLGMSKTAAENILISVETALAVTDSV